MRRTDDAIRDLWRLTTATGVVVHPMAARVQAAENAGYEVREARALLDQAERLLAAERWSELRVLAARVNAALRGALETPRPGLERPATLAAILASRPSRAVPPPPTLTEAEIEDRVLAGWYGKAIGGALGGPVEGWTRAEIAARFGPVDDYLAPPSSVNDDTAYQLVLLRVVEEAGAAFTSEQLGLAWVERIREAFTAEEIAITNLEAGVMPPRSATRDNPFGHWIGGMMKGEICGWLSPGRPDLAMDLAYRDAVIAHHTEGVYGELFTAVTTSAAFVESDPRELLHVGLAWMPVASDFADILRRAIGWCEGASSWEQAWSRAEDELVGRYHWIHTFPNLAAVVVALWFGQRELGRSIAIATMCGQDTDSTTAQVGALIGTAGGMAVIEERWRRPIGDVHESTVVGMERIAFRDLAARTAAAARRVCAGWTGA